MKITHLLNMRVLNELDKSRESKKKTTLIYNSCEDNFIENNQPNEAVSSIFQTEFYTIKCVFSMYVVRKI